MRVFVDQIQDVGFDGFVCVGQDEQQISRCAAHDEAVSSFGRNDVFGWVLFGGRWREAEGLPPLRGMVHRIGGIEFGGRMVLRCGVLI